ncbi:MAG: hypothetical protein ACE5ED_08140 [Rhodothalassiaceae bacterium]
MMTGTTTRTPGTGSAIALRRCAEAALFAAAGGLGLATLLTILLLLGGNGVPF